MYDRQMAQGKIDGLVHQAEAYRRSRQTRAARAEEFRGRVGWVRRAVLSLVLWPVRH